MEGHKAAEFPEAMVFGQRSATFVASNSPLHNDVPLSSSPTRKGRSKPKKRARVDSVDTTAVITTLLSSSSLSPAPKRRKLTTTKKTNTFPPPQPPSLTLKEISISKEKNIFTVNETRRLPTKLKEYEDILCSYCLMLYKLCSSNTTKLSEDLPEITYPPITISEGESEKDAKKRAEYEAMRRALSLGKTKKEKHLTEALYHLEQVLSLEGTFFDDYFENNDIRKTKTMYRNLQQSSSKVLAQLSTVTKTHLEANKICKKSVTVLKKLNEILADWDRWKIQYISELRVHYDPTLCGGISKPTLDVFSAQSNASKMRLGVVEKLALRREELIKELQQVENQLTTNENNTAETMERKTNVTNDLLNVTASSMEISRNEREIQHLDTQDKISSHLAERYQVPSISRVNGTLSTAEASATYRQDRQRRVESVVSELAPTRTISRTMSSGTIEVSEEDDSEEEEDDDDEMTRMRRGTDMPSLLVTANPVPIAPKTAGMRRRKKVSAPPVSTLPKPQPQQQQQPPRVSFGFNSVKSIDVTWDKDSHDIPLDKVNWASKTTVRMPQNLKF